MFFNVDISSTYALYISIILYMYVYFRWYSLKRNIQKQPNYMHSSTRLFAFMDYQGVFLCVWGDSQRISSSNLLIQTCTFGPSAENNRSETTSFGHQESNCIPSINCWPHTDSDNTRSSGSLVRRCIHLIVRTWPQVFTIFFYLVRKLVNINCPRFLPIGDPL